MTLDTMTVLLFTVTVLVISGQYIIIYLFVTLFKLLLFNDPYI